MSSDDKVKESSDPRETAKSLLEKLPTKEQLDSLLRFLEILDKDIKGDSDRAAAITLAAYLESLLEDVLHQQFVNLSKGEYKEVFGGDGPLATIESKLNIAYAMGLIDKNDKVELKLAFRIRNRFAHDFFKSNFSDFRIVELCNNLKTPERLSKMTDMDLSFGGIEPESRLLYTQTFLYYWAVLHELLKASSAVESSGT